MCIYITNKKLNSHQDAFCFLVMHGERMGMSVEVVVVVLRHIVARGAQDIASY